DFTLACSPSVLNLYDGNTSTCTVTSTGGFSRPVHLGCSRLLSLASCAFEPAIVTPTAGGTVTSTLTLSAGTTPTGTYEFQAEATRPGVLRTSLVDFIVGSVPGGDVTAAFDAARQARSGGTMIGRSCDPTWLLTGRGLGPRLVAEPHAPNTISDACNEAGSSTRFPADRFVDRVKASTVDGTPFGRGKQVRIDADVGMLSHEP